MIDVILMQGPKQCVGMRFAMLNVKAAVVHLLRRYKVVKSPRTLNEYVEKIGPYQANPVEIFVRLEKRVTVTEQ